MTIFKFVMVTLVFFLVISEIIHVAILTRKLEIAIAFNLTESLIRLKRLYRNDWGTTVFSLILLVTALIMTDEVLAYFTALLLPMFMYSIYKWREPLFSLGMMVKTR